jgi:hypothetical protein
MKKTKIFLLSLLYMLTSIVEFSWSVLCVVVDAIGEKLTELTDVTAVELKKAKS